MEITAVPVDAARAIPVFTDRLVVAVSADDLGEPGEGSQRGSGDAAWVVACRACNMYVIKVPCGWWSGVSGGGLTGATFYCIVEVRHSSPKWRGSHE